MMCVILSKKKWFKIFHLFLDHDVRDEQKISSELHTFAGGPNVQDNKS
jgi:hypothetical protein